MKKLINKILSVILTAATAITMMAVPASAVTTVAAPVADVESGTYYEDFLDCCNHSSKNKGYHYFYNPRYYNTGTEKKAIKNSRICSGDDSRFEVELTTSTKGAQIYFDMEYINDSSLTADWARKATDIKYSVPIVITEDTKITAYAVKNGVRSKSVTYTYRICPRIKLSHESGTYDEAFSIMVTNGDGLPLGSAVYYTTDGNKPTENSQRTVSRRSGYFNMSDAYIDITESCTLRLLVVPGKGQTSYYLTKKYTIKNSGSSVIDPKGYEDKYYYNTLNERQQKAYASVYKEASLGFNGGLDGFGLKAGEGEEVKDAFFYENPEFPIKIMGWDGIDVYSENKTTQQKKLKEAAEPIIEEAEKLKTDYEKVKYFHDTIINNTVFNSGSTNNQTAYGVFVDKKAACQGYSNAFAYLCQSTGIDCIIVAGKANGGNHAWNMVKVNNNWYHIDLLWDDPVGAGNTLRHTYFLVSDAQIKKDHTIDMILDLPAAPKNYNKTTTSSGNNSNTTTTPTQNEIVGTSKYKATAAISTKETAANYLDLGLGSKIKLSYLFTKTEGVKFTSNNSKVAKIVKSTNGTYYVKGAGIGDTYITATYKGQKATLKVCVYPIDRETTSLKLSVTKKTVSVGKTIKITAKMNSDTEEYVNWFMPSNKVAKFVNGTSGDNANIVTIKGVKKGTVKVYAITSTGDVKVVTITVK